MANNNNQDQLLQLRSKIDKIDNSMIELLNERFDIVKEVGKYKKSINESFFVKSAREADMIKDLLLKTNKSIPPSAIVSIWRKIIASANFLEQDLNIAIFNPNKISDYKYLIREYYGDFIPFHQSINSRKILLDVENQKSQIGVFCANESIEDLENIWWKNLAQIHQNIKIFAKIPFIGNVKYPLFIAAIKAPEKSSSDQTLIVIQSCATNSPLIESNLNFKILQSVNDFYLVEIDGFFEEQSPQIFTIIENKNNSLVKIIGHFANPIT